jgi:CheY-like chemotaxis protein/PAS domain-containing protein
MGTGLDLRVQRKDGSRTPVEISLSPFVYDSEMRVTAVVRDVTERKRAELRLRELHERFTAELTAKNKELELRNSEIESANRLKTEFVASMSHELRTPLHAIIGFAELLAEEIEGPLSDKQKRFVDHFHRDSLHLLELINDILDLSRIEAGRLGLKPESFAMIPAIEEVLATIRPQAVAKSLHLAGPSAPKLALRADRVRFQEVLYNLLGNAVKIYARGRIHPRGNGSAGYVCRNLRQRRRHWNPGVGTRRGFRQVLSGRPDHARAQERYRPGAGDRQAARGGPRRPYLGCEPGGKGEPLQLHHTGRRGCASQPMKRILIADDQASSRELLRTALEYFGHSVVEAVDGVEAVAKARETGPDLVLLDLHMPALDGFAVMDELRREEQFAATPVVALTASAMQGDRERALAAGFSAYLTKPIRLATLRSEVERLLG